MRSLWQQQIDKAAFGIFSTGQGGAIKKMFRM
jgi:hypothetical protein